MLFPVFTFNDHLHGCLRSLLSNDNYVDNRKIIITTLSQNDLKKNNNHRKVFICNNNQHCGCNPLLIGYWALNFFASNYYSSSCCKRRDFTKRHRQGSNLRGINPMDFKSIALTTRPRCLRLSALLLGIFYVLILSIEQLTLDKKIKKKRTIQL